MKPKLSTGSRRRHEHAGIRSVIKRYDSMSDEDWSRLIATAPEAETPDLTMILVPRDLLPKIKALIARHRKSA